jgi:MerR family transcriptional regulator, copper efflux regulator
MSGVTIGEAARRAGVGVETIRFYERRGLIQQPAKPPNSGFRVYSSEQIERIKFIRQAQQIGFSLGEIEELLSLRADPNADCADVREQAAAKLDEVERKIEQLRQIRAALQALLAVCPGRGGLQACTILDTLIQPNAAIKGSGPLPATPPKRRPRNGSGGRQRRMS